MKRTPPEHRYKVEPLAKHHYRQAFTCGVEPLESYLRQQASQDVRRGFATVFVGVEKATQTIHGYHTLLMAGVAFVVDAKDEPAGEFYRQFGFRPFLDDPRHLFLVRETVERPFQRSPGRAAPGATPTRPRHRRG